MSASHRIPEELVRKIELMAYKLSPHPLANIVKTVNEQVLPQCVLSFGDFVCSNFFYDYEAVEDEDYDDDDELLGLGDVIFTDARYPEDDDAVYYGTHIFNNQYKQYCERTLEQSLAYKFFNNRGRRLAEARGFISRFL